MAKAKRTRSRDPSRRFRAKARPYKFPSSNRLVARDVFAKDCPNFLEKRDWENVICPVCMECPHNAVLLLCSSHDKGCRPYMCGTSFRYSNCLDQYKKASAKLKSLSLQQTNKCEFGNLTCPLCRGQVKGWTIVQPARDFLNLKKRICMQENCVFTGTFKELRKHMKTDHPSAKPREVDPNVEENWRRFEVEHDMDDVMSTIRSTIPGSVVVADYVIERNDFGPEVVADYVIERNDFGPDSEEGVTGFASNLVNLALMLHALGAPGNQTRRSDSDLNARGTSEMNFPAVDYEEEDVRDSNSNSLASRMRRQGRTLLGRSGRRRRDREANQNTGPSPR